MIAGTQQSCLAGQRAAHQLRRLYVLRQWKFRQTNYWRLTVANGWTPERRVRQAELISHERK
jgi:hypothetical protein